MTKAELQEVIRKARAYDALYPHGHEPLPVEGPPPPAPPPVEAQAEPKKPRKG